MAHTGLVERIYEEFGQQLKVARKRAGLTQKEVASRVGLSRTSVTNIEKGRQHVALHQVFLLAEAIGCSARDLMPTGAVALEDLIQSDVLQLVSEDREGRAFLEQVVQKSARAQKEEVAK